MACILFNNNLCLAFLLTNCLLILWSLKIQRFLEILSLVLCLEIKSGHRLPQIRQPGTQMVLYQVLFHLSSYKGILLCHIIQTMLKVLHLGIHIHRKILIAMSTLILQTLTGKDRQTITSKETGEQGFQKDRKGPNNERAGTFGLNSEEHQQQPQRSYSATYSEQEILRWRDARRKNHPSREKNEKTQSEQSKDSKCIDREVLQRELKEVLAKQAELGVEVAEIPSYYLKNAANQGLQSEENETPFT
ncbi:hypothetical protein KIW84_022863, partial [Lathyrus oleraceus]